ncbi:MAG: tRNA(1-methyladenosine) methyltransferase-like methyltransferase, partial [Dehalococcoidia bacterium]|nr:tRNA(1-methyladenosine) methyltransferase-like methyltransferase [Dehalococcoidia bacterium]
MKRQAQVIYPKDLGPILIHGDIFPGAHVLEAGVGAGALTLVLLRAVGPQGHVTTYEIREDLAAVAARNVKDFMGDAPQFTLKIGDVYAGVGERNIDRVVLDVPEPWQAIDTVGKCLHTGGIFISYLPTVLQIHRLQQELSKDPRFDFIEAFEVL